MRAAHWPVKVVEALPPMVDTDMTAGHRKLSATETANQISRGVGKNKTEVYVGASLLLKVIMRISPALGEKIMLNL